MNNSIRRRAGAKAAIVILSIFIFLILLAAAASAQMLGDVNNDGVIDIRDVVLVQRYILGYQTLTAAQLTAADVNGDGVVNVIDANLIMQFVQGHIHSFPTHHLHAPVLISPIQSASVDGSMVSFQWGAVSGATRYQLEITKVSDGTIFRTVNLGNVTSTTEYAFANDGVEYRWRVRAGSSATQWGAWSTYRTFTNGAALPAPTLGYPADNASLDSTSVSFQWSAVTGATRYQLEAIRTSDGFIFKNVELGNVVNTTQTGFPNDGTEYRWRVRAGNAQAWGAWSPYRHLISGKTLPAPVLTSPANNTAISGTSVLFRWNEVSGATKYQLEVLRGSESIPFKDVTVGQITMSEQFGFLRDGTQYRWRVRAGNNTGWGTWSAYFNFSGGQLPNVPTLISPIGDTSVSGRQVTFSWQPVTGATNYELEIVNTRTGAFVTKAPVGNTTASSQRGFDDDGSEYRWRVRAASAEGWGAWSNYATFVNGGAPGAPVLTFPLHNEKISRTWINFEWKPVVGADRYQLEITKEGSPYRTVVVNNMTTSLQSDFVADGSSYTWKVKSGNINGWSSNYSATRTFIVGTPFKAPTLILPSAFSTQPGQEIEFSWRLEDGATVYHLEVVDYVTGAVFADRNNILATNLPIKLTGFGNDAKQYKWRVRAGEALAGGTRWGTWTGYWHFINETPARPIAAPTLLSPASKATATGTEVYFNWTPVTGAIGYNLQVLYVNGGNVMLNDTNVTTLPSWQSGFPDNNTEFMWRVRSHDGANWGAWSFYSHFYNGFWFIPF